MVKNLEFEPRLTKKNAKIGYKATKKGLKPLFSWYQTYAFNMELPAGIEPVQLAWEARVLPLNYESILKIIPFITPIIYK